MLSGPRLHNYTLNHFEGVMFICSQRNIIPWKFRDMQLSNVTTIRKSVDSLCRDGANAQYMQYLSKSRITSPQLTLKAYLSVQASSLSAFVISKTQKVCKKVGMI